MRLATLAFLKIALTSICAADWAQAAVNSSNSDGFALLLERRTDDLASFPSPLMVESLPQYISTQQSDGTWPDVNYASGCDGRE
jgi:hypothetical protein